MQTLLPSTFPVIQSNRITLRALQQEDVHELFKLRSNLDVRRYVDIAKPESLKDAQTFIQIINDNFKNSDGILWAMALKDDNKLIGTICYWHIDFLNAEAEIGYMLHPAYWRKGFMMEAIERILEFGIKILKFKKIVAGLDPKNEPSARLLEKVGFEYEGLNEEGASYVLIPGNQQPMIKDSTESGLFSIRKAGLNDIPLIRELNFQVWPQTYAATLTQAQIDYMLDLMYSEKSLERQMNEEHCQFIIIYEKEIPVGFASYSEISGSSFKLHKIYVLISQQGKGTGKYLLNYVEEEVQRLGARDLHLQVNRHNKARLFYEKMGYTKAREVKIDIGQGFFMDDYVMEKKFSGD